MSLSTDFEQLAKSIADSWSQQAAEAHAALVPRLQSDPDRRNSAGQRSLATFVASLTHDLVVDLDRLPAGLAEAVRQPIQQAAADEFAQTVGILIDQAGEGYDELRWLAGDMVELGREHIHEQVRYLLNRSALIAS